MKEILFIILVNFCFTCGISQNNTVKGKILPRIESEYEFIRDNVRVLICTGCDEFSTGLNNDLTFEFENLKTGPYELWIEPFSRYSIFFKSGEIKDGKELNIEIPVSFSCIYDQSESDRTCPICNKENRVVPVSYGMINSNANDYYSLGCLKTDCDPNWYCKRDKHLF